MKVYTVSVICLANLVRSPIAAFCLNREIKKHAMGNHVQVVSRGIYGLNGTQRPGYSHPKYYQEAWKVLRPILEKYKIDLGGHHSRLVTGTHLAEAALILPVHSINQNIFNDGTFT